MGAGFGGRTDCRQRRQNRVAAAEGRTPRRCPRWSPSGRADAPRDGIRRGHHTRRHRAAALAGERTDRGARGRRARGNPSRSGRDSRPALVGVHPAERRRPTGRNTTCDGTAAKQALRLPSSRAQCGGHALVGSRTDGTTFARTRCPTRRGRACRATRRGRARYRATEPRTGCRGIGPDTANRGAAGYGDSSRRPTRSPAARGRLIQR